MSVGIYTSQAGGTGPGTIIKYQVQAITSIYVIWMYQTLGENRVLKSGKDAAALIIASNEL